MTINFKGILDKPIDQIEAPKALPEGSYGAVIAAYDFGESREKKTPFVEFKFAISEALDDVAEDALKEAGGIDKKSIKNKMFVTEDSAFRLKDFLADHAQIPGKDLTEMLENCVNATVGITVVHNADAKDPTIVYSNVGKTFSIS